MELTANITINMILSVGRNTTTMIFNHSKCVAFAVEESVSSKLEHLTYFINLFREMSNAFLCVLSNLNIYDIFQIYVPPLACTKLTKLVAAMDGSVVMMET